mmetsp:Transcript_24317/g.83138  ORF Transcript_24317/g.83138 Transcript_24317/m.83138 type:complete len:226 (+) Transcript_24317:386-1063(+)
MKSTPPSMPSSLSSSSYRLVLVLYDTTPETYTTYTWSLFLARRRTMSAKAACAASEWSVASTNTRFSSSSAKDVDLTMTIEVSALRMARSETVPRECSMLSSVGASWFISFLPPYQPMQRKSSLSLSAMLLSTLCTGWLSSRWTWYHTGSSKPCFLSSRSASFLMYEGDRWPVTGSAPSFSTWMVYTWSPRLALARAPITARALCDTLPPSQPQPNRSSLVLFTR